ncbi:hypothetical protein ACSBR2_001921 [Camellia fascicularis]
MGKLKFFFFPMMAQGHMIPTLDMAKLFSSHGVDATIITTPLNAPHFTRSIQRTHHSSISVLTIKFPAAEAGLPEGCESIDQISSPDMIPIFFRATDMLQDPLERLLQDSRPDCLVADMFFPWTTHVAAKFDIPRLVFHGTSFFAMCALQTLRLYKPQRTVSSDNEPFVLPNLPHKIMLTRLQLPENDRHGTETDWTRFLRKAEEAELSSYGIVVNSFYELEPDYADHYRNVLGRKAWHIGPVSLFNREVEDKAHRGKESAIEELECLKWLDSKKPNSVIYVCFGSTTDFTVSQLYEIAMGLDASGQQFIWVVRKGKNEDEENDEKWLPEGFEKRIKDKGLIIRGWAPQVLILDHESIGGFVTHCGWNSILEGVCAGVPMVTWPVFAEQFYNEKLVTEILRIGIGVGARQWQMRVGSDCIKREAIAEAVKRVMEAGEEAEGIRSRARAFKDMAKKAVEEGGSSYADLKTLIQELSS